MRLELVWRQVLWLQTPLCSAGPAAAAARLHTTWYQQRWGPPTTSPTSLSQNEKQLMLPEYKPSVSNIGDESYHSHCIRVSPPAEPACCPGHRAAAAPETRRRSLVTLSGWSCSLSRWASGRGSRRTWCAALPCCPEGCRYSGFSPPTRSKWRVKPLAGDTCPQCWRRASVHRVQQVAQKTKSCKTKRKNINNPLESVRSTNRQLSTLYQYCDDKFILSHHFTKFCEKLVIEVLDLDVCRFTITLLM